MEEMGRAVACRARIFSTVLLGGLAILERWADRTPRSQEWLPKITGGRQARRARPGWSRAHSSAPPRVVQLTAKPEQGRPVHVLSGTKLFVHDAHEADRMPSWQAARTRPTKGDRAPTASSLFLLPEGYQGARR